MDDFIIVYLDNIIIYLNSKKEYKKYIKWVLSRLYKENIPVVIKKCKFYTKKTDFRSEERRVGKEINKKAYLRLKKGYLNQQ